MQRNEAKLQSTSTSSRKSRENRLMHGITVALLSEERERLATLQDRLQATRLGREVFSHLGFPISATDTIIHQLQESRAEVVIVEVSSQSAQRAIRAIELIRATTQIAIFASGDMTRPDNIVASMRNGASEYFDCSAGYEVLLEALTRFSSLRTRASGGAGKARVFTFLSAKGGQYAPYSPQHNCQFTQPGTIPDALSIRCGCISCIFAGLDCWYRRNLRKWHGSSCVCRQDGYLWCDFSATVCRRIQPAVRVHEVSAKPANQTRPV